jgi:hypothetical protein
MLPFWERGSGYLLVVRSRFLVNYTMNWTNMEVAAKHRFTASRNTLSQRTGVGLGKESEGPISPVCDVV